MNVGYLTALSALVGSAIGGLTSLATTWLSQYGESKRQQQTNDRVKRETLFAQFIDDATALYADAFTHEGTDLAKLAELYAIISRMRLIASEEIVKHAEEVSQKIIETYLAPNKSFNDVLELKRNGSLDPLKTFSEACREDLRRIGTN